MIQPNNNASSNKSKDEESNPTGSDSSVSSSNPTPNNEQVKQVKLTPDDMITLQLQRIESSEQISMTNDQTSL